MHEIVAKKKFNTEKVIGCCSLVGGVVVWNASDIEIETPHLAHSFVKLWT